MEILREDRNHFVFEINAENSRIRHTTTLKSNDDVIQIQSRSMTDPPFSDIDFKNKMALASTSLK